MYNNTIYAFDIETTTTPSGVVCHYLSNFLSVDFRCFKKSKNDILSEISDPIFCRTVADVNKCFERINKASGKNMTLIYVHNLAYEFDFLIKNVDFVKKNFDNQKSLFIKPRIPLFIKLDKIELRCSYKLLNQSLENIGNNLGYEKLSIDYNKQYFPFSKLPDDEYRYNQRDTEITLLSVLTECSKWEYIHTVDDIPLTATSFSRKNNDYINSSETVKTFSRHCNYQRFFSKEYIDFLEKVYSGGYTHANAFFVGRPLHDVTSVDITSSYPHSMLHRDYPNFFHEFTGQYKTGYFKRIAALNNIDYRDALRNYRRPFKRAFLCCLDIGDVNAKILKNNNLILPLSLSKCENIQNARSDNGRLYKADFCTVYLNEVDYYILTLFYDFKIINCKKLYITKCYKPLEDYITNSVRQYLNEKSTIKKILKKIDDGAEIIADDFFNENKNDYIFSDDKINAILSSADFEFVMNDNYRVSKNRLNAQYGSNVQRLIPNSYQYEPEIDEYIKYIEDSVQARVLKRDFTKGLYITAYSRLTLFLYALYLIDSCECSLIYSDTDSWKILGDNSAIIRATERYNEELENVIHNSIDYGVGEFDVEGVYLGFSTLGCKKYIVEKENNKTGEVEIQITIAGVNKKKGSEAYTELYRKLYDDFDALVGYAFTPCTILDNSIIDKKCIKYHNEFYALQVTDENGDTGNIFGYNMCELCESDYILMNIDKPAVRDYIDYFSELQGENILFSPTVFFRNESGDVDIKNIRDWKKTLKIYDTIDLEKIDMIDFE